MSTPISTHHMHARIRALAQGVRVYALDPFQRYVVPSAGDSGKAYEVTWGMGDYTCTCPAGQNGRYCKHIAAVEMRVEAERAILTALEAQEAPSPTSDPLEPLYGRKEA